MHHNVTSPSKHSRTFNTDLHNICNIRISMAIAFATYINYLLQAKQTSQHTLQMNDDHTSVK